MTASQVEVHHQILGDPAKPALLMMHGWGQTSVSLQPLAELLSSDYRVVLVDLPGFGRSPLPAEAWDTVRYAERMVELLDELKIDRCDLLGHSFGGRISLRLASRFPDRVQRLFLVASHGLPTPRPFLKQLRMQGISMLRSLVRFIDRVFGTSWYTQRFIPHFASVDYQKTSGVLRQIFVKLVTEDATADAVRIKAPALLLWGEQDTETPVELGRRLQRLIQGAALRVFPLHDHHPFSNAGHHLLTRHILEFKRQHGG